MTAIAKNMTDTAYAQLLSLKKQHISAREAVDMTIDSLMEEFSCSRRRAAFLVMQIWADLETAGHTRAHIDLNHTTGQTVVIKDQNGRTCIFSINELLQLRAQAAQPIQINA